jgi:16S rRNA G966 N2-methylase RsmD
MMGKVKEAIYSTLTSFGIYSNPSAIRHLDIFAGSGSVGLESLSRGATHCTFVDFSPDCCHCIQRNIDLTGLGTTTTTAWNRNDHFLSNDDDTTTTLTKTTLVCCTDAMTALTNPYSVGVLSSSSSTTTNNPYQIITICPPYEEVVYGDLLEAVVGSDTVTEDTIVIIEYPIELLQVPKQQRSNNRNSIPPNNPSYHSYGMPHVIQSKNNTAIGIRNRKYGRTVIAMYIINPTGRYPEANSRPEEFVQPV